jgi:methionine aminopeptidase
MKVSLANLGRQVLRRELPCGRGCLASLDGDFVDATGVLERLRAIKTPGELAKLRQASELITDSMLTTIAWAREGTTKAEIIERLRREETGRGLHFDYCLLTVGASHNRAPSGQAWRPGEVLSIDSGGNFDGYIGDLARMGVLGEPDAELEDLLAEIDGAQQAAFATVRAGGRGGDVISAGEAARTAGPSAAFTDFVAHGMGLISHEVPFLLTGGMYEGVDADRPLEAGMVLSVETTMLHPRRGFIARGHRGGHRRRLRDVRRPRTGVEPRRAPAARLSFGRVGNDPDPTPGAPAVLFCIEANPERTHASVYPDCRGPMLSAMRKLEMTRRSICLPDLPAVSHVRRYSLQVGDKSIALDRCRVSSFSRICLASSIRSIKVTRFIS